MSDTSKRGRSHDLAPRSSSVPVRRADRPRGVALTGVNTVLGRGLLGLLEDDERVGRVVLLDLQAPRRLARKSRFYEVDLTSPGVDAHVAEILHAEEVDELAHLAFLSGPNQATAWAHELESVGTRRGCTDRIRRIRTS
jgi:UDP-glucose 4-epimerase